MSPSISFTEVAAQSDQWHHSPSFWSGFPGPFLEGGTRLITVPGTRDHQTRRQINVNVLSNIPFVDILRAYRGLVFG